MKDSVPALIVAQRLQLSRQTVYQWAKAGRIPGPQRGDVRPMLWSWRAIVAALGGRVTQQARVEEAVTRRRQRRLLLAGPSLPATTARVLDEGPARCGGLGHAPTLE